MFNSIGEKIKRWAMFLTVIEIIACIVIGIVWLDDEQYLWGCLILFVGPFASWLSNCPLYAFGELVNNSKEILEHLRRRK